MERDYFAILGLAPGRYNTAQVTRRFQAQRGRLLRELEDPARHAEVRRELEALHLAYAALRDPAKQAEYLEGETAPGDELAALRRLIAASLEGGLLRYSRRQQILEEGRRLGLSDFQIQVVIAEVQFGGTPVFGQAGTARNRVRRWADSPRAWAHLAAAAVLGLALFLLLLRWLG